VGNNFFAFFNNYGAITSVPTSFKWPPLSAAMASDTDNFKQAFFSPNTIDRLAQDIINGCAAPNTIRATFSFNQPGYATLDPNWQE